MTTPPPGGVGPVIRRTVNPAVITSDFESRTHEQLRAMIEHADAAKTRELGDKLKTAGVAIGKIGEDLRTYMSHVNWEGEAGDAFRKWGANMVNATTRLGEFSDKAGTWMGHAAETLSSVKSSMPEYSAASKATLNSYLSQHPGGFLLKPPASSDAPKPGGGVLAGPTPEAATAAQKRLDEDHAEAVSLMRKLAGSYVWSAHNMGQVERPQFPPVKEKFMPAPGIDGADYVPTPGVAARPGQAELGLTGSQGYEDGPARSADTAVRSEQEGRVDVAAAAGTSVGAVPGPRQETGPAAVEIDGGVATPQGPALPSRGPAVPSHEGGAPDQALPFPTQGLPPSGDIGRAKTGVVRGEPIGEVRQRMVPGMPGQGGGGGTSPGQGVGGRRVNMPGMGVPNDGIVGGRPMPRATGPSPAQALRGTVIGTESGSGRPPMGHGIGAAMPGAPSGRMGGGQGGGRRLATESGGVVGGRLAGAMDRPFTPGGTGLVRSPGEADRSLNRSASRSRQRPDYLVEDEESWPQSDRRIVPPVID
ncbi:hypothetical protein [Streptomyces netropsis]|uniref:Uncharacterized protein YukE n=1 Tax=Streptomyces netropsis TaxID=55404 RepID=A0A7W7L6M0_STRNE|nr:hypothetical protein [Streptomyces netropsis]MBB4884006.1 uncharacterized protein YukE [Streptomyces netropsis]GGR06788.1 hypothetical protein GCM10010219_09100 [Streptomyces netropsis]